MDDNKSLWRRAFTTDPSAVKVITGKQYSGNSPKPYWIVERLTDEFGPCGIGWGFNILNERYERFGDSESLHIAVVRLWYVMDGKRGELEQVGQTRGSYMTAAKDGKAGRFLVDEDAPKKSVTDALVKCASYLGFAGDIFSGRWDDSRYVRSAAEEWADRKRKDSPERDAWLVGWLDVISLSTTVGDCRRLTAEAVASAQSEHDADAESQFLAAQATKMAQAKKATA